MQLTAVAEKGWAWTVEATYLEIYQERLIDLLAPGTASPVAPGAGGAYTLTNCAGCSSTTTSRVPRRWRREALHTHMVIFCRTPTLSPQIYAAALKSPTAAGGGASGGAAAVPSPSSAAGAVAQGDDEDAVGECLQRVKRLVPSLP